jgi:hypothetical protein
MPVTDLNVRLPFALVWRKDNNSDGKRNLVGPQDKLPLTPAGASTIVGPKSKWLKPSSKTLEETR